MQKKRTAGKTKKERKKRIWKTAAVMLMVLSIITVAGAFCLKAVSEDISGNSVNGSEEEISGSGEETGSGGEYGGEENQTTDENSGDSEETPPPQETTTFPDIVIEFPTSAPQETIEQLTAAKPSHKLDNMVCVMQNPELPTGCEVTSLTIVLNYLGFQVDKCTMADDFLDKGEVGSVDAYTAFLGNPRYTDSYGCFAPVIVNCANKYFSSCGSPYKAYDITGSSLDVIFGEIENGRPVMAWATMDMDEPYIRDIWDMDGEMFMWPSNEHCIVLYGFDRENNIIYAADPLKGLTTYPMDVFEDKYKKLLMQAVTIR